MPRLCSGAPDSPSDLLLKKDITVLVIMASKLVFMDSLLELWQHPPGGHLVSPSSLLQDPHAQAVLWGARLSLRPALQEGYNCPCNYGIETCIYGLWLLSLSHHAASSKPYSHSEAVDHQEWSTRGTKLKMEYQGHETLAGAVICV